MKRNLHAEKLWADDYEKEFGEKPSQREINIGVYDEDAPAFFSTPFERFRLVILGHLALWRRKTVPVIGEILKYGIGFAIGQALYAAISTLF